MPEAILTIDDSPSPETDRLTGFLKMRGISALLFCRGDRLEANPDPVVRAIEQGFTVGNHAFSHRRFSTLSCEEGVEEIERTERLIDAAHEQAGVTRSARYFRFPHLDRGCGGWVVDYDAVPEHRDTLIRLFADGLNIDLAPPDAMLIEKKIYWQDYLAKQGFSALPAPSFNWFAKTEMARAVDSLYTFSTADWMLTPRHRGKRPYKTLDDLQRKIDNDPWLNIGGDGHIVLAHDQEGLFPVFAALAGHLLERGFTFRNV